MLFSIEFDVTVFDVPVFDVTLLYLNMFLKFIEGPTINSKDKKVMNYKFQNVKSPEEDRVYG